MLTRGLPARHASAQQAVQAPDQLTLQSAADVCSVLEGVAVGIELGNVFQHSLWRLLQAASALNGTREGDKPLHVSIQPLKQRPPRAAGGVLGLQ